MTRQTLAIASAALVIAMATVAILVGSSLPDSAQLPIHWDLSGTPDGFAGKWEALLLPVLITAGLSLLFYFLPLLEPRGDGLSRSQGLYLWGWVAVLLIAIVVDLSVVSVALGWGIPVNHLIVGGVGLALILIGNQLGKSRRMYLIGLRTPWTLASEEVWIKTHRLAGKLMVAAGGVMILAALLPLPSGLLASICLAAILIAAVVPTVYSYLLWRREKPSGQSSG